MNADVARRRKCFDDMWMCVAGRGSESVNMFGYGYFLFDMIRVCIMY